ncbi:hypothetical protein Ancab_004561, partial [Ancistrocladus abbreviatus]
VKIHNIYHEANFYANQLTNMALHRSLDVEILDCALSKVVPLLSDDRQYVIPNCVILA